MSLEFIVGNLAGGTRWEMLEGRRHLVGPVVIGGEAVLNGSQGAFFYPRLEWEKTIGDWNGKPVIVNHAELQGKEVSAADPEVFNRQKVGILFKSLWNGKARAEAWIDEEKANKVDPRIIASMLANQVIEVSTGLKVNAKLEAGTFEGTPYKGIATEHKPDHLALLPDDVGAYSIADGGGLLQLNKESGSTAHDIGLNLDRVVRNALSHEDLRKRLVNELRQRHQGVDEEIGVFVEAVFNSKIVYELERDGSSTFFAVGYSVDGEVITLEAGAVEVVSNQVFQTVDGTVILNEEEEEKVSDKFDKKKFVGELITNEQSKWSEDDREALMGLSDEILQKFEVANAEPEPEPEPKPEPKPKPDPKLKDPLKPEPVTLENLIANASPEDQELFAEMRNSHGAEKQRLVNVVTANAQSDFTKEELGRMALPQLRKLAALAKTEPEPEGELVGVGNWSGAPRGGPSSVPPEQEPLGLPTWE
jgi:hypothetical protein